MYVEQTPEGFNIMSIPSEVISALRTSILNQVSRGSDQELTKDDKRALRKLSKMLDDEVTQQS